MGGSAWLLEAARGGATFWLYIMGPTTLVADPFPVFGFRLPSLMEPDKVTPCTLTVPSSGFGTL